MPDKFYSIPKSVFEHYHAKIKDWVRAVLPAKTSDLTNDSDFLDQLALAGIVASIFSTSSTYEVDDYVLYNHTLYRCKTAISTAGAWDSSKWDATKTQDIFRGSAPGLVPAAESGDADKVLKGDGTWTEAGSVLPDPTESNSLLLGQSDGSKAWNALSRDVMGTPLLDESNQPILDENSNPVYDANSTTDLWTSFAGHEFGARRAYEDQDGNNIKATYATRDTVTTVTDGLMSSSDKAKLDGIANYLESASVSGNTLTLTPKSGAAVTFTAAGEANTIESVKLGTDILTPDANKAVTIPLFAGTANGAVSAPASANRNAYSFLNGMGDWSMAQEVTDADIDRIFVDGVRIGGRKYPYVQIGNQLWITENLDYKFDYNGSPLPTGSGSMVDTPAGWYKDNNEADYGIDGTYKCGLLYNWYAAYYLETNKAALLPDGWRVPSKTDFETLVATLGSATSGQQLKALDNSVLVDWPSGWNGTDVHGFNTLPAGCFYNKFADFNNHAYYWSSTDVGAGSNGYALHILKNQTNAIVDYYNHPMGQSIRLVKNVV